MTPEMSYDDKISKIKNLMEKSSSPFSPFTVWIQEVEETIIEVFTRLSPQYNSIIKLIGDYNIDTSYALTVQMIQQRHKSTINLYLGTLLDKLKENKAIQERNEQLARQQEYQRKAALAEQKKIEEEKKQKEVTVPEFTTEKIEIKVPTESKVSKLWKQFSSIAFWTILIALMGGAFGLGFHFGNNKFDQVKNDLVDSNRVYKDRLLQKTDSINDYQQEIGRLTKEKNKSADSLGAIK